MMTALDSLLETYRTQTATQRDKGTAFEKLIAAWLVTDPVQSKRIAKAELWSDWAKRHDTNRADVGIDLVCTRHDGGLAAVQCKLYDPGRRIQKSDIDSFISASAKDEFAERLFVETTEAPWSENALAMVDDQSIPTTVIGLQNLRESPGRLVPLRGDWRYRSGGTQDATGRSGRGPGRRHGRPEGCGSRQAHHGVRHRQDLDQPADRRGTGWRRRLRPVPCALLVPDGADRARMVRRHAPADYRLCGVLRYTGRKATAKRLRRGRDRSHRPGLPGHHKSGQAGARRRCIGRRHHARGLSRPTSLFRSLPKAQAEAWGCRSST